MKKNKNDIHYTHARTCVSHSLKCLHYSYSVSGMQHVNKIVCMHAHACTYVYIILIYVEDTDFTILHNQPFPHDC